MTALNDFMDHVTPESEARMLGDHRLIARGVQRVGGVALLLAAFGLWLQPGALWEADVVLLKIVVSLFAGLMAILLLQSARPQPAAKVVIDTLRREIRLVRAQGDMRMSNTVIRRTPLAEIGRAECTDKMIRLWTQSDDLIAEVALTNPELRRSLIAALKDAGKL